MCRKVCVAVDGGRGMFVSLVSMDIVVVPSLVRCYLSLLELHTFKGNTQLIWSHWLLGSKQYGPLDCIVDAITGSRFREQELNICAGLSEHHFGIILFPGMIIYISI